MAAQFIELKDRILWFDGDSTITNLNYIYSKILRNEDISHLYVKTITPEIKTYNQHSDKKLVTKQKLDKYPKDWNIPNNYKELNLRSYILKKLENEIENNNFSADEIETRIDRIQIELQLWEIHNMNDLLKTLIYMIDTFIENNTVWGTGRGSSCACYILYLIGLHNVDSIYYNLDIKEFFRS